MQSNHGGKPLNPIDRNVYLFLIRQLSNGLDGLIRPSENYYHAPGYSFDLNTWWITPIITAGHCVVSGIAHLKKTPYKHEDNL